MPKKRKRLMIAGAAMGLFLTHLYWFDWGEDAWWSIFVLVLSATLTSIVLTMLDIIVSENMLPKLKMRKRNKYIYIMEIAGIALWLCFMSYVFSVETLSLRTIEVQEQLAMLLGVIIFPLIVTLLFRGIINENKKKDIVISTIIISVFLILEMIGFHNLRKGFWLIIVLLNVVTIVTAVGLYVEKRLSFWMKVILVFLLTQTVFGIVLTIMKYCSHYTSDIKTIINTYMTSDWFWMLKGIRWIGPAESWYSMTYTGSHPVIYIPIFSEIQRTGILFGALYIVILAVLIYLAIKLLKPRYVKNQRRALYLVYNAAACYFILKVAVNCLPIFGARFISLPFDSSDYWLDIVMLTILLYGYVNQWKVEKNEEELSQYYIENFREKSELNDEPLLRRYERDEELGEVYITLINDTENIKYEFSQLDEFAFEDKLYSVLSGFEEWGVVLFEVEKQDDTDYIFLDKETEKQIFKAFIERKLEVYP